MTTVQKTGKERGETMITTIYGNQVKVETAVFDQESGNIVGAFCLRGEARRYYRVMDLRHPDGISGVISELEAAPNKITEFECDTQEVY